MAKKGFEIPQTRGSFQVRGIVTGTEKDNFYKEQLTKTNKPMRFINFGVQFNKDSTVYISLNGMETEKVYFSKREEVDGKKKTVTKDVPWRERHTFAEEGYRLIGVNVGVSKTVDEKGKEVNDKKTLVQYDACNELYENLKDGQSVFVRGEIEYSTYNGKHQTKFVPNQISLCKPVEFETEDFKEVANFTQSFVFMGIKPNEDKSEFTVDTKIVGYNTLEDAEFYVKNSGLANTLRKGLKPYQSIEVWGDITAEKHTEEVEETDCWGESNAMERVSSPTVRKLVITGADPKTIEKEVYSEAAIDAAIAKLKSSEQAKKDFGDSEWGSLKDATDEDDEAGW